MASVTLRQLVAPPTGEGLIPGSVSYKCDGSVSGQYTGPITFSGNGRLSGPSLHGRGITQNFTFALVNVAGFAE